MPQFNELGFRYLELPFRCRNLLVEPVDSVPYLLNDVGRGEGSYIGIKVGVVFRVVFGVAFRVVLRLRITYRYTVPSILNYNRVKGS